MSSGSVYFRRIRTIDLNTSDTHLLKALWFLIGFTHTGASESNNGYGIQILFSYSFDRFYTYRISTNLTWARYDGNVM